MRPPGILLNQTPRTIPRLLHIWHAPSFSALKHRRASPCLPRSFSGYLNTARTGLRFYNPDAGRWQNRDPIAESGGIHVYGFVSNYAVGRIDIHGLVGSSDISHYSRNLLHYWTNSQLGLSLPSIMGVYPLMQKLMAEASTTSINHWALQADDGHYAEITGVVTVKKFPDLNNWVSVSTLIHELVHRYNDVHDSFSVGGIFGIAEQSALDEGTAYTAEHILAAYQFFKEIEIELQNDDTCAYSGQPLDNAWRRGWGYYGTHFEYGIGDSELKFELAGADYLLDETDVANTKRIFGLELSCTKIAQYFNTILEEKGCCYRVSCNRNGASIWEWGANSDILSSFR